MSTLIPVPHENVAEILPLISDMIDEGVRVDDGRTTRDEIVGRITSGTHQLWLAWDSDREDRKLRAMAVSSVTEYPQFKAGVVDLAVGENHQDWLHFIGDIEDWARLNHCDRMEIPFARPGWARGLKDYKKRRIFLEKRL